MQTEFKDQESFLNCEPILREIKDSQMEGHFSNTIDFETAYLYLKICICLKLYERGKAILQVLEKTTEFT